MLAIFFKRSAKDISGRNVARSVVLEGFRRDAPEDTDVLEVLPLEDLSELIDVVVEDPLLGGVGADETTTSLVAYSWYRPRIEIVLNRNSRSSGVFNGIPANMVATGKAGINPE